MASEGAFAGIALSAFPFLGRKPVHSNMTYTPICPDFGARLLAAWKAGKRLSTESTAYLHGIAVD